MSGLIARQITEQLRIFPSLSTAILFGSAAIRDTNPFSDLDIAVQSKQSIDSEFRMKLIEHLASQFGRPIDLIDLRTVGEPLLGEILKGIRLFGSNHDYAQLLNRHLVDAADFIPLQQRILKARRDSWIQSS